MASITQRLYEEHQKLFVQLEQLRMAADAVGDISLDTLQRLIDPLYAFLTQELIPHAHAENIAFYPIVGKVLGSAQATAPMQRDHVEIERLTEELAAVRRELALVYLDNTQTKALRRILYSLYALIKLHFIKEEEIYFPLLDERLTSTEAQEMLDIMEQALSALKAYPAR